MISLVISVTIPNYHSVIDYIPYAVHCIPSDSFIFKFFKLKKKPNSGNSGTLYFWGAPKSLQIVTAVMKLKDTYRKAMTNLRQHTQKQRDYFAV